jgi:AcrR family transcriptional regulator
VTDLNEEYIDQAQRLEALEEIGRVEGWIMPAMQARSRRTLGDLLDTARELLNEKPFDEITVAEICRLAGCSPPSFYQRFRDKEALLHAIHEQYRVETLDLIRSFLRPELWEGRSIDDFVDALVRGLLYLEGRAGGLRTTTVRRSHPSTGADDDSNDRFAERLRGIREELYGELARVLDALRSQFDHPEPERASRFLIRLIQGTVARHFEAPHLESHPTPTDEFVDDLRYAALAYLRADSTRRGASAPPKPSSGSPSRSK